jgi:hypothetical protein
MRNSDKLNLSTIFALMYKRMSFLMPSSGFFGSVGSTKFPFVSGIQNFKLFSYIYNVFLHTGVAPHLESTIEALSITVAW